MPEAELSPHGLIRGPGDTPPWREHRHTLTPLLTLLCPQPKEAENEKSKELWGWFRSRELEITRVQPILHRELRTRDPRASKRNKDSSHLQMSI